MSGWPRRTNRSVTRPVARVVAVVAVVSLSACGASSPDLDQRLGAIDQAILDEDFALARDEVNGLLQEAAQADLEPSDEDAITTAGTALLERIDAAQEARKKPDPEPAPEPIPEPTPEPTPSESTPEPEPPEVDDADDKKDDKKKEKEDKEDKEDKEKEEKDKKKD